MPDSNPTPTAVDAWNCQSVWSTAANNAKKSIETARRRSLILIVAAAVLGAADPLVAKAGHHAGGWCALAAGIALGLLPLVRAAVSKGALQTWVRLRSTSEALKTEVYTYLAGAGVYRAGDTDETLANHVDKIVTLVDDLLNHILGVTPVRRELPAVIDIPSYLELRVDKQINDYYDAKAKEMSGKATLVRWFQVGLGIVAVVLGAIAAIQHAPIGPWIGVVGTISGAIIAHGAAARYDFLELEYLRTAEQLRRTVATYRRKAADPAASDALVDHCEQIISIQNEAWMAELVKERDTGADPHIPQARQNLPQIDA